MKALDTDEMPPRERGPAVIALMRDLAMASNVVIEDPDRVFMSTSVWMLGPVELVHTERSGLFMDVTKSRDDHPPILAMMLGSRSGGAREQDGTQIEETFGVVDMIELNRPHKSWIRPNRHGWCIKLPAEALALTPDTISRARNDLFASPLQPVFASHMRALVAAAPALANDPAAAELGAATLTLARALVSSAGHDELRNRDAMRESLFIRIEGFLREHLRDPDLSPSSIAAAHHISVRMLYRLYSENGLQLEQTIIDRRLDGARWELSSPAGRVRSIAAVAQQWGFIAPSHFTRRFKHAYGMTPREYQAAGHVANEAPSVKKPGT